ncbi:MULTISPECIES: hypothetical protein [Oceanobacillus]|uniref:hypothetical protein n=1 Tax=Oceanobacillus TaxID=182709 RepID=UPI0011DD28E9|nr:hypothetical protein [Oceanobacillus jeddahense]
MSYTKEALTDYFEACVIFWNEENTEEMSAEYFALCDVEEANADLIFLEQELNVSEKQDFIEKLRKRINFNDI